FPHQAGAVERQGESEVYDVDVGFIPIDQSDMSGSHENISRIVRIAGNHGTIAATEARPGGTAAEDSLGGHGVEINARAIAGFEQIERGAPAGSLRPVAGEAVKFAQGRGNAGPIRLGLRWAALHMAHHHKAIDEEAAVLSGDGDRD